MTWSSFSRLLTYSSVKCLVSGLHTEDDDGAAGSNEIVGWSEGLAEQLRYSLHRGHSIAELAQDHEDDQRRPMGWLAFDVTQQMRFRSSSTMVDGHSSSRMMRRRATTRRATTRTSTVPMSTVMKKMKFDSLFQSNHLFRKTRRILKETQLKTRILVQPAAAPTRKARTGATLRKRPVEKIQGKVRCQPSDESFTLDRGDYGDVRQTSKKRGAGAASSGGPAKRRK